MMRYSVVYDDLVAQWAVVDTRSAGLVITVHGDKEAAVAAAEREEKTWPARESGAIGGTDVSDPAKW